MIRVCFWIEPNKCIYVIGGFASEVQCPLDGHESSLRVLDGVLLRLWCAERHHQMPNQDLSVPNRLQLLVFESNGGGRGGAGVVSIGGRAGIGSWLFCIIKS